MEQAQKRRLIPAQSDEIPGWPDGPAITAQAAIVMEADTGTVLYAKNIHEQLYPASTTKILTCLLAAEESSMTEEVTFSETAVLSIPPGSSSIGIDPGEMLTMEQALYGILVGSANEVANGVAEHVSGSIPAFVERMNKRAKELGCADSHFANTNGLPDSTHVTSAYDLAVIARAFFAHPVLARIAGTPSFHFSQTAKQKDDFTIRTKNKLVNGEIPCEGIIGGKTGYTDLARETLVTCAERDGMRLICVVLKEESPAQFTDTVTLLDYGFHNFRRAVVAEEETRFLPLEPEFSSSFDIFGDSGQILSFDPSAGVVLPAGIDIGETETAIRYGDGVFACIDYSWHGVLLGSVQIRGNALGEPVGTSGDEAPDMVTIRLFKVMPVVYGAAGLFCLVAWAVSFIRSYHFGGLSRAERRRYRRERRNRRKEGLHLSD
ncbi:MAG: D-alanyl-D-alanine carboxypeptidase [Lachnospiraceae bacterium]|nr:D-alanyl-D-alanine carboxypeptidase [Lachnospiraceae bacterium]